MSFGGFTHPGDMLQLVRAGQTSTVLDEQYPFYPLDAPGMPVPGKNFVQAAIDMGDPPPVLEGSGKKGRLVSCGSNLNYLYRRALYDEQFFLPVDVNGVRKRADFVPGHLFGESTLGMNGGPRRARIMVIGKNPGREELRERVNFVGPTSQIFFDALDELGVSQVERDSWYITNLVKWPQLDDQSDSLPKVHKADNAILLEQELRLVLPEYILCLGSDASKWVLTDHERAGSPARFGVESMVGRSVPHTFAVYERGEPPRYHTAQVMTLRHPASVHRTPELYDEMKNQLALFLSMTNGVEIGRREKGLNHVNVYKHRHLKRIVDEILADPDPLRRIMAFDGEWNGQYPNEPGSYLRTIQFSTKHGEGICVVLRNQGGSPAFQPSIGHAIHELKRLTTPDPDIGWYPQIGGHFFRADLPWLAAEGLDLREQYRPAPTWDRCRNEGGWDTGLMYHAVNEATSYRLTDVTVRLTTVPVYDTRVKRAVEGYLKEHNLKQDELEGYGFLPQWILHPNPTDPEWGDNYAQYDPDVTRRVAIRHLQPGGLLDADWFGNSCWEPYWKSHMASLGVLEMEQVGLPVDKERVDRLTSLYMMARSALIEDFRRQINWPTFNPGSPPQCTAFLFGDRFTTKRDKTTGAPIPIRPPNALTLNLTPIKTTGKRSRLWADVVARGEERSYKPSVDKEVLGIIGHEHPLAMQLRDIKFISQILTKTLRPPVMNDDGTAFEQDDDGNNVYEKGLASYACSDGHVRTHISQNKETGRASSARPPLQNISNRREGDYGRILGRWEKNKETGERTPKGDYLPNSKRTTLHGLPPVFQQPLYDAPIRTIFRSMPGTLLVEADYTGAELAVIAWMSGDRSMIEHIRRNILPEKHPDHYDIHSQTAVRTFRLTCEPTKKGLSSAGYGPLRVAAKNVNFGIPYGRSAEAIARQCKEEGVDVTEADCQLMIDFYYNSYPDVGAFLAECRRRSQEDQWLTGCFGRFRRFIRSRDRGVIGDQERQSQNFPIQNTVADAVWTAVSNFDRFKREHPDKVFWQTLQIHDALLFQVPIENVVEFAFGRSDDQGNVLQESILHKCMVTDVPIWPRHLDNTPMRVSEPYRFGIDLKVQVNWGENLTPEVAAREGIPEHIYALVA